MKLVLTFLVLGIFAVLSASFFWAGVAVGDELPMGPWPLYVLGAICGVVVLMGSAVAVEDWRAKAMLAGIGSPMKGPDKPLIIRSPQIGFLNLLGGPAEAIMQSDHSALADLFSSENSSNTDVPSCDVLMLYAALNDDGSIEGTDHTLESIGQRSGSIIVILATANEHFKAAVDTPGLSQTDLVITLDRGPAFADFFGKLFKKMMRGTPMPMAWVELAPQSSSTQHGDAPNAIYLPRAGPIAFAR